MRWIFLLAVIGTSAYAAPPFQVQFMSEKNRRKESSRWTITDYLAQKNRVHLMDQWLALNRQANFFEMLAGGGPLKYTLRTQTGSSAAVSTDQSSVAYRLALYLSILGVQGEYEKTDHDTEALSAAIAVRVFGTSQQTTNLTLKYGMRRTEDKSVTPNLVWNNQFAEASLDLYIISLFGINGEYRHYFPDDSSTGTELRGSKATAGAFLEYGIFRLYGNYFMEKMESETNSGQVTKTDREGYEAGLRLYF